METHSQTLTADPAQAVALCQAVPGLGLTLDPSHYIIGPHKGADFDQVYPYVQNVHLRDTGKGPGEFQVRVGQGEIEYNRIVNLLARAGYDRCLTISILDLPDNTFEVEVEVRKLKLCSKACSDRNQGTPAGSPHGSWQTRTLAGSLRRVGATHRSFRRD